MPIIKFFMSTACVLIGWLLIKKIEPEYAAEKNLKKGIIGILVFLLITSFLHQEEKWKDLLTGIFWATMALAAFCDSYTQEIYDFCYFPWLFLGFILALVGPVSWPGLLIFIALQLILFRKMYGESDCLAFIACALYMAVQGKWLLQYLILMAVTFSLLTVIQLLKRNVNRHGNLKKPVPLIPYIAAAMTVMEMFL